jgi:RimJ/RimL family protein N-acetyltransferase
MTAADAPMVLQTTRLRLVPIDSSRAEDLAKIYADPEVAKYIGGARLNRAGTSAQVKVFEEVWAQHGYGQSALLERATGRMIGRAGLHFWAQWQEVELGYVLARDRQGCGLAREAAEAWMTWAWARLSVGHLIAVIEPENVASVRLAERLGFAWVRRDLTPRNVEVDVYRIERPTT